MRTSGSTLSAEVQIVKDGNDDTKRLTKKNTCFFALTGEKVTQLNSQAGAGFTFYCLLLDNFLTEPAGLRAL
jgi:hypothetical protein